MKYWQERTRRELEDPRLFLEPADVLYNLVHLLWFDRVDLGHVAELPMMCLHACGHRSLKGRIAMVVRLIDFVDERWSLGGSDSADPMAARTVGIELLLSITQLDRS